MKLLITFLATIVLIGCNCKQSEIITNDDFLQDLSSEDNRVWGDLYLGNFDGNLSSLTFDYYLHFLDSTLKISAQDLVDKIQLADSKLLSAGEETFWVFLYYKNEAKIIGDNAITDKATVDTIIIYNNSAPPDLNYYASQIVQE